MASTLQWQISLRQSPRSSGLSDIVRASVIDFYYRPEISRELPGKRDQINIRNMNDGTCERVSKKILEVSLSEAFQMFKQEFPQYEIGQRSFEVLRPRDVTFAKEHHRQVCCCIYHINLEYSLKVFNQLSANAGENCVFRNVHAMTDATQCNKNIECIMRDCAACGPSNIDSLFFPLKCRPSCPLDCFENNCLVEWLTFERINISETDCRKRLALNTRRGSITEFQSFIKEKLALFALHRFMAGHVHEQYRHAAENIQSDEILLIMDFAENYSSKVPHEVQSLHWVNVQATLFVIVLTRHAREDIDGYSSNADDPKLVDEHHIFISDDHTHDFLMVEWCKKLLFDQLEYKTSRNIEFCDGACSQFKSYKSLALIAQSEANYCNMKTIRYWWESSHGKHKADGAGGVVKNAADY